MTSACDTGEGQFGQIVLYDQLTNHVLRNSAYRRDILRMADLVVCEDSTDIHSCAKFCGEDEVAQQLVRRLAASKLAVKNIGSDYTVAIVIPMWRETRRLQPQSPINPTGEDCLMDKLRSLDWLFGSRMRWHVYCVDDDCPEGSLTIAHEILNHTSYKTKVTFLSLRDGFPYRSGPLSNLRAVEDSTKGGAVCLGILRALHDGHQFLGYTDCDNSTHIGQLGSLLLPLAEGTARAAVGDRKNGSPFRYWHPSRETESDGARVLKHLRGLLTMGMPAVDTYSPFKLFDATALSNAVQTTRIFDFSFDFDLLAALSAQGTTIASVGCMTLDSFEETTWTHFGDSAVWLQKLRGMADAALRHGLQPRGSLAEFVRDSILSTRDIACLIDAPAPAPLKFRPRAEIGRPETMPEEEVIAWMRQCLS